MMMAGDGEGANEAALSASTDRRKKRSGDGEDGCKVRHLLLSAQGCHALGEDANWGRVLCAIGYAGVISTSTRWTSFKSAYGQVDVCVNGAGINFSEEEAAKVLHEKEITILVELNSGDAEAGGCDLTYDYICENQRRLQNMSEEKKIGISKRPRPCARAGDAVYQKVGGRDHRRQIRRQCYD